MLERVYQAKLIKRIKLEMPGCIVLKNDTDYLQGVPDLTILYWDKWGMLEVKADANAPYQPNQEYYLGVMHTLSFASVIYPEIEEEVLRDLQLALKPRRSARVLKR